VIRQDRELLAELARVNSDVVPTAMRIMEGSATADEQHELAGRLIATGRRLHQRADSGGQVVEEAVAMTCQPTADMHGYERIGHDQEP
jgi:predicted oxidoreductase